MHTTNLSDRQAARLLAEATPEGLLQTFAALTHRLHVANSAPLKASEIRVQRDRVQAELLRRMGA